MSTVADRWMQACYPNVHLAQARPVEGRRTEMNCASSKKRGQRQGIMSETDGKSETSLPPAFRLTAVLSPMVRGHDN